MNIFVINSGSSSIKYQLFQMPGESPLCNGIVERIGQERGEITHKVYRNGTEDETKTTAAFADHGAALEAVMQLLTDAQHGVLHDPGEIEAVGHRVVHGGERFSEATVVTEEVKQEIERLASLAPLHNPPNLLGIRVAEQIFPRAQQVVVFDTAFHQTMPERAFRYAIPNEFYRQQHIRVYGFHGTSHKYVAERATDYLGKADARLITLHLGNGCSMAAVRGGKSLETSMGFTPMNGLVMGTRCGDIDPSVLFYLINDRGYDPEQLNTLLNKQSGMLGLTGHSDMRDIARAMDDGNPEAALAYAMYTYRIRKYIGAYGAVLNGLDALVFTAGVGENDARTRAMACADLDFLGIRLDAAKNEARARHLREINVPDAPIKILVVPTNEELEIARQCFGLLKD
ncbi:acetate kinase [Catalinimonas alkaloidigena]|uniref:Acetate kinase n=1 Tax=Catalinimonas alkaloidigena TaxID=1075417 RepID=A0A1G9RN85_9BACT|nr:acetate kinase [Catalinimonas alkaloidigena]SDM24702.1 acetate kinase [Catalinimonas alkaloidigena]